MSDAQDAEQFSGLWALAGRPELFDSAYELADLRDQAAQAGVDLAGLLPRWGARESIPTWENPKSIGCLPKG